jgi:DNA adenine methylase
MNRSFIRWAGGKGNLIPQLKQFVPDNYSFYIEPFVGGGSMFFSLQPKDAVLADINEELINLYIVLRNNVEELIEDLKRHKNTENYYYKCRNLDRTDEYFMTSNIRRASRTLYINKTCFNGLYRVNSDGKFNVPFGYRTNPKIVDEHTLRECSALLKNSSIQASSYDEVLETYTISESFIYLDPPYAPVNETSFTSYTKEDFGEEDHYKLRNYCDRINTSGAFFMQSNSYTPFILDLYSDYIINTIYAPRFINSVGSDRGKVAEVVITNYEAEPAQKDFWEL